MFVKINGFNDYMVNHNGDVYSILSRKILKQSHKKSRTENPYKYVTLKTNSGFKKVVVHRLVAMTFIGDISGMAINHLDGNPSNNHFKNLEICDTKRNAVHAFDVGLNKNYGQGHYLARLTKENVFFIVDNPKLSDTKLSKMFNVSRQTVSDVRNGRTWKRVLSGQHSI